MVIAYSHYYKKTSVLGPGQRFALWVSGCGRDCPGCIAQGYMNETPELAEAAELAEAVLATDGIDGVTISGGEPFLQAAALAEMLVYIRERRRLGVVVYTGYRKEELEGTVTSEKNVMTGYDIPVAEQAGLLLAQTDILIDGPFMEELNDDRMAVGSSNQRVLRLSDYYQDAEIGRYYQKGRRTEIVIGGGRTLLVGVPDSRQRAAWMRLKACAQG